MSNTKTSRNLFFTILALFLTAAVFTGCRTTEEPGHAEFNSGKIAYNAGDYESAVEHYKLAADQGNLMAQTLVGHCFMEGLGVEQDHSKAVKWFRTAAEQGFGAAQLKLGQCYDEGKGVEKDDAEAVKWYKKAADQGVSDA